MADHVISLNATKESVLKTLTDEINRNGRGEIVGTKTVDDVLKDFALIPINARLRDMREQEKENLETAYEAATAQQQAQVKAILGLA